jgi:hypothetical protein
MIESRPEQFQQTFYALVAKDMRITVTNLACHRHNGIGSLEMAERVDGVIVEWVDSKPAPEVRERNTVPWWKRDRMEHNRFDG